MLSVSIIIVNYNSGDRLTSVCGALAKQTFKQFDVIVIDNASTDDSIRFAAHNDLNIQIVRNRTNSGFAGGVMDAAEHAKGQYLALLNPDAYPEPDWLEKLVGAADAYGPKTFLGSVQLDAKHTEQLDGLGDTYHASGVAWRGGFGKPRTLFPITEDMEIFAPCFAAALVDRTHFLEIGGLDRDFFCYHEDVDVGFRNRLMGGRSVLVHDAVVHHEGSAISGRYSEFTVHHGIRNRMWTMAKNMPGILLIPALPLYLFFSAGFLLRSFMLKIGKPYVTGFWAGLKGIGPVLRKRRMLSKARTARWTDIAKALSWSPIAPFRRAPHLRPIEQRSPPAE